MKQIAIIIALALPGAFFVGLYGWMVAAFSGDADPTPLAMNCWLTWGIVGGACLGGMPGWILGLYQRARWVIPFVGAALGAVLGIVFAEIAWHALYGVVDVRKINLQAYVSVGTLFLGVAIGLRLCVALVKQDRRRRNDQNLGKWIQY